MKAGDRPSVRRVQRTVKWGKKKYAGSWAEYLWHRLDAVDFMNQAMLLAATFLLCAVPFLLIANALAGRSAVSTLTDRLGLSQQAAADVGDLFTSSSATDAAVTGLARAFFILAGIAAATAIQALYQRIFQLDPRGLRDTVRALIWLALVVGWTAVGTVAGPRVYASVPVMWWIVNIPAIIGFWWFTMWFLLAGRASWRRLYSCALTTGAFWLGMLAHVLSPRAACCISQPRPARAPAPGQSRGREWQPSPNLAAPVAQCVARMLHASRRIMSDLPPGTVRVLQEVCRSLLQAGSGLLVSQGPPGRLLAGLPGTRVPRLALTAACHRAKDDLGPDPEDDQIGDHLPGDQEPCPL
jgi:membrane protein